MKLKTVDFSTPMSVARRFENLPVRYELYSLDCGAIFFRAVKRGAWCSFAKETDVDILCETKSGSERCYEEDGRLTEAGETILFPSKDMRDNSRFYAPAKDEVVHYGNNNNTHVHISGKWFRFTATSGGKLIEELDKPCYIAEKAITAHTDVCITGLVEELQNEKGLILDPDTLEWSEAEKEYTLSDGSKAYEGDEVIVTDGGMWRESRLLEKKSEKSFVAGYTWKYCLLKKGNEQFMYEHFQPWHIGKLWPSGFRTGQPVLARNSNDKVLEYCIFSHEMTDTTIYIASAMAWQECYPYHGNETLVGTKEEPKE